MFELREKCDKLTEVSEMPKYFGAAFTDGG